MKTIHGLKNLKKPLRNSIVTIGVFDGVHIGHRSIIKEAVSRAKETGAKSIVMTFDPHPMKVLNKRAFIPSLISLKHKIALIGTLGPDYLVILKFTRAVSMIPPKEFVKKILIGKLGMREIYVGENFYFGKGGAAGVEALKKISEDFGFKTRIIKPLKRYGAVVSSSAIRRLVLKGEIVKAAELLGRPVSVLGTVISGSRRGRLLGFPTANIDPHHEVIPPSGVYAVNINVHKKRFKGVLNIGTRPTFWQDPLDREPRIEAHLFGFDKKIYGEDMEILFVKKIRDEAKFKTRKGLSIQIKHDVRKAISILNAQQKTLQNQANVLI